MEDRQAEQYDRRVHGSAQTRSRVILMTWQRHWIKQRHNSTAQPARLCLKMWAKGTDKAKTSCYSS